jgi:D-arabinose 5-phosphate isomerase GutQ
MYNRLRFVTHGTNAEIIMDMIEEMNAVNTDMNAVKSDDTVMMEDMSGMTMTIDTIIDKLSAI